MKKIKQNFWKPFLLLCIGLIIATVTVTANQFDTPGKPGKPEIIGVTSNSCEIRYTAPEHDGGSAILGYLIEVQEKGNPGWEKANFGYIKELECTITGGVEGHEVRFRVYAANKAGLSYPSDVSEFIVYRKQN